MASAPGRLILRNQTHIETHMTTLPSLPVKPRSMTMFWVVVAVCVAPVVASYVLYYGVRPEGRTNHGDLLEPQQTVSSLSVSTLVRATRESGFVDVLSALPKDDARQGLSSLFDFRGRWLLIRVGPPACDATCEQQLWVQRQVRLATGRERDRVERIWLIPQDGSGSAPTDLKDDYSGTWVLGVRPEDLAAWPLLQESRGQAAHLWLVDPLGNLMMRFPIDADPARVKTDLMKLLKASRIG